MADREPPSLPPLPPLPDDERETAEQARPDPAPVAAERPPDPPPRPDASPRRPRADEERRLWSAGHALVVCGLALMIGLLLNAPGAHKKAYNQPEGWQRDVALAITGPLDTISGALLLDRPRRAVQALAGRRGGDAIDTEIPIPVDTTPPAATPTPRPKPTAKPTPAPRKKAFTPKRKLRLWVVGDSLVITPGWAVVRAAGASPVIEAAGGVDGRVATGLTRPDVFNWFAEIRKRMKELKPAAVVMGFGGNDDKEYMTGVPDGITIREFGDAAWRKEYARRVGGVMDMVAKAGAHVVWIGLPQTRDAEQTRRFDVVNAVVVREARKREATTTFVDTYTLFASESGGFTEYLPDGSGGQIHVRAADGVHFERAGGDMIAREVLRALNRTYDLTSWKRAAPTS